MMEIVPANVAGYHDKPEAVTHQDYNAFVLMVMDATDKYNMGYQPPPQWNIDGTVATRRFEVFLTGWHLVAEDRKPYGDSFDPTLNCHIYPKRWAIIKDIVDRNVSREP